MVHGIRDHAVWASEIQSTLEQSGFTVRLTSYGRFGLFDFLSRSKAPEERALKRLADQLVLVRNEFVDHPIHLIAHSFGTYLVTRLLGERTSAPTLTPIHILKGRLIFCGSVAREDFRFDLHRDQVKLPVVNEIGTRDHWPAIARFIVSRLGGAGTYGFKAPGTFDRRHKDLGHGDFLNRIFCEKFWIPILKGGEPAHVDQGGSLPKIIDVMGSYRLAEIWRWLLLIIAGILVAGALAVWIVWAAITKLF